MEYITTPILTATLTIIGGALTLAMGQFFIVALLKPVIELKREIGRIAYSLDYYANKRYCATDEEQAVTRMVFRKHACRLREIANIVIGYKFWQQVTQLPKLDNVYRASSALIGQSNFPSKQDGSSTDRSNEICRLLRICRLDDILSKREKTRSNSAQ
jgi:hypothetical protein